MILAGTRPPEYVAALRAERARRAAAAGLSVHGGTTDAAPGDTEGTETSAVDIAPRPPSD